MTRDELYINNTKVDLGKTDITLSYKSNLLTDISKIVSNSSYTIKLPKTARNLALIECSHIPSSTSRYPYLKHKGTLIRNGIEIIKDANIVLLETGEFIEIALTWGNVTNFAGVVNDGKKLTDITHGTEEGVDWVVWNNKGSNSVQFPLIDYGFNSGDPNVWYHPVIPVWWILDKIQEENGVTFNFPADRINFINRMIVPLLSNNDSQELYDKYPSFLNVDGYNSVANSISYLKLSYTGDSTQTNFAEVSGYYNSDLYVKWDTDLRIIGDVSFSVTYNIGTDYYNKELRLHVKEIDSLGSVVVKNTIIKKTKGAYIESSLIKLVFNFDENIHVDLGQYIDIVYQSADISTINYSALSLYFSARGEVLFGEKLPLVPNLPDVKQIDFIKAIASMVGLFALPDGVNGIKFIPFDNLSANKFKAVDWTNRVIMAYRSVTPRSLKYTLDNIAQNNRFQYKEDDKVKGDYDGNIQVNDATIDYERDAIKLPFSACDAKNGVAYIPMYSYNENGELQYNKTNPRILLLDGTKGVFKGLEWTTLIANNYQTYKGLINDAKVVTEYIRLNSIELRDLEMDVPVYLAQYGCYLAIIEIKTNENDICECKLLKL
jgi:hypothetical protein